MGLAYRSYAGIGTQMSACSYYRMILPMTTMEKLGLPIVAVLDDMSAMVAPQIRSSIFLESDFSLIYQATSPLTVRLMEAAKTFKAMKDSEGEVRYPPTFICDTDDDVFNVTPLNITYGSLGVKRGDGTLANDGDEIGIAHPVEIPPADVQDALNGIVLGPLAGARADFKGARYVYGTDGQWHDYVSLYRDGVNVNFAANREKMENWRKTLKLANLVTCSTPRVAAMIEREVPGLPTFVTPNAIDFDEYNEIELRDHPGEVRILWEGSATHHEGLWPLNKVLQETAEKYPETTWYFFGAAYKWAMKNLPQERVKSIPWVPYQAYKLRLSTIGHDIALAPLAPNVFNDSRSAIRWYENSAIWKPAATIAQKWGAFQDEIQDGETGLLFENPQELKEKLGGLIENEKLRQTLASNAKDWVRTNREAKKIALKLFHKWSEVREEQKLTIPFAEKDVEETKEPAVALT